MTLTPKEHRFCEEYVVDLNATQAAIRAGYSRHTARQIGSALLTQLDVKMEVETLRQSISERTKVNAEWLLQRMTDEVEADVSDLYDTAGALLPVSEWPLIWRQGLITAIDVEVIRAPTGEEMGIIKKIKIGDRVKRLELIGRHVGVKAFETTVVLQGMEGLADRLDRAVDRIETVVERIEDGDDRVDGD